MTQLNPEIEVLMDDDKTGRIKYVAVDKGLVAGAFEWKGQLHVRYQITDPELMPAETAMKKVRDAFGFSREDVRNEHLLHKFDDGTELRQFFLGEYEA